MITQIQICGFRGVTRQLTLPLGTITLLSGRNGLGKTTLFDAVDWCLFGSAWRFADDPGAAQNLYVPAPAEVSVTLATPDGSLRVTRSADGACIDGRPITDKDLALRLVRDPDLFPPYSRDRDHSARVRRLVYLTQSEMRDLLATESGGERAALFSALAGVPNAAVVTSSIRRIEERLDSRIGEAVATLAEINGAIDSLASAEGEAPREPSERRLLSPAALRDVFLSTLGATPVIPESAEAMLSVVEQEAASLEAEEARLRSIELFRAELEMQAQRTMRELESVEASQAQLADKLVELTESREGQRRTVESIEGARRDLVQRLATARDELTRALAVMEGVEAAEALKLRVQQQSTLATTSRERLSEASSALQAKDVQRLAARARLQENAASRTVLHNQILEVRRKYDRAARRQTLVEQLAMVGTRLEALRKDERVASAAIAAEEQNLATASGVLGRALEASSGREQLLVHVAEAARLARDLNLSACPLCGAEYASDGMLLDHMRMTYAVERHRVSEAEEQRKRVQSIRASLASWNSAVQQVRVRLAGAEREAKELATALGGYEDVAGMPLDDVQMELNKGAQAGAALNRELAELTAEIATVEAAYVKALGDVQSGEAASQVAERTLAEVSSRLAAYDGIVPPSREHIETLRASQVEVEDQVAALERHRAVALKEEADLLEGVRAVETEVERTSAEARSLSSRLVELEAGLARRMKEGASVRDATAPHTEQGHVRTKLEAVRVLRGLLSEHLGGAAARAAMERRRTLSLEQAAATARLEECRRASARLAKIADAVRGRIEREGSGSLGRAREVIQECLDALYPHRHLNKMDIREQDVVLSDDHLDIGVQPQLYASTGQLNVLALAVFIGVALTQRITAVRTIMMDEPVQNLDDLHFLAFLTLLRRVALDTQVIFSTADSNVAELFARQMRSTHKSGGEYFVHHEWRAFDALEGPTVVTRGGGAVRAIA